MPLPSDPEFFALLDLNAPALGGVRDAVNRGDYRAAREALAAYYRRRTKPDLPLGPPAPPNYATADAALVRRYTVCGLTYTFTPDTRGSIDWSHNPSLNADWTWEFNRFYWWSHYTSAYLADPVANARYAEALFAELRDWLDTSPLNLATFNGPGSRWRNLETGLRLEHGWSHAFMRLKHSPLLSDDLLVDWVKGFYLHARHLVANAERYTNRGACEANGLFVAGVLFPEFTEAASWRELGQERMVAMIHHDVFPDGVENENSPAYHNMVIGSIAELWHLAGHNGIPVDPAIPSALRGLYDYLLYASDPGRVFPLLNDSYRFSAIGPLRRAARLFPERTDYLWIATGGAEGSPPERTSHLFPDAGQAVMRSGWASDANYLLFDGGPFGTSHGHEDKLSLSVSGYGVRHLIDCGPYDYEPYNPPRDFSSRNPYRIHSVSSQGKTIPLVDGLDQYRRKASSIHGVPARELSPVRWLSSSTFDYAAATYGDHPLETWGKDNLRPAAVTRHVFFLKPATWVVLDDYRPHDDQPHIYSALFQCSAESLVVDDASSRFVIQLRPGEFDPANRVVVDALQPSLSVTPLAVPGLALSVVKGQDEPFVSGYQYEKNTRWKKQPVPTARYAAPAAPGEALLAYVLAAAPASDLPRAPTITRIATAPGTLGVRVSPDQPGSPDVILLVARDGRTLTWEHSTHDTPALLLPATK